MGKPSYHSLGMKLGVSEHVIQEHLALVDTSTPKIPEILGGLGDDNPFLIRYKIGYNIN